MSLTIKSAEDMELVRQLFVEYQEYLQIDF
jgi:hypothetical protein